MTTKQATPTQRIAVADALRGFALLGIVLVHNVEHFDLANTVETGSAFLGTLNEAIRSSVFFLFGGKAYAIFALLFGFSFYIQYENCRRKGIGFAGRFAWRMCLLFCFGLFHVLFYSGEILSVYAIVGLLFIPLRGLSDRWFVALAILFMLEPWEIGRLAWALCNPDYVPYTGNRSYYLQAVQVAQQDTTFFETAKVNLHAGLINAHMFAWFSGRYFQTFSLFLIGALLGRRQLFIRSERSDRFWKRAWGFSIAGFIPLFLLKTHLGDLGLREGIAPQIATLVSIWSNFAFTAFLVSSFVLLWFHTRAVKVQATLAPYGRMSLTNYVCSSIIGSFIYYGHGLGLFAYLGDTFSLLVGAAVFTLQLLFSRWWLGRCRYGPFEGIWHKLTWIKLN